jgi:glutamate N-acetyltransferase/amino-acid N-acetyltransferase
VIEPPPAPAGIELISGGGVTTPEGFAAGAVYAGIKTLGERPLDVGILASDRLCNAAAVFTRSTVRAFAVQVSQEHLRGGRAQAIIVNSGCSNVATGAAGLRDTREMARLGGRKLLIDERDVIVGSTGVIGRSLPMDRIRAGAEAIVLRRDGGAAFARAIMTTDTHPKEIAVRFRAHRRAYAIGACAKGSGMIHPDMATMFCWITTDAPVERTFLRAALRRAVDASLNMISVDNDTSTSDTVAVLANGAGGGAPIRAAPNGARTREGAAFERALTYVCIAMARMLARDGEGAQKLIEVRIEGAASEKQARAAARTVSASPLVKSAVHGNDPNWGRLLMAVGRSGAKIDLDRARAWLGDVAVFRGNPLPFDEAAASAYLRNEEVLLRVHLGAGTARATAWGCDLTPEYVHINSDYTT